MECVSTTDHSSYDRTSDSREYMEAPSDDQLHHTLIFYSYESSPWGTYSPTSGYIPWVNTCHLHSEYSTPWHHSSTPVRQV